MMAFLKLYGWCWAVLAVFIWRVWRAHRDDPVLPDPEETVDLTQRHYRGNVIYVGRRP